MQNVKRILISIILPDFNLMDRYSAVASVVFSIADLLRKEGYEIYVNDKRIEEWEAQEGNRSTHYMPITRFSFIRFFPKRLRELIKDILFYRKNKNYFQAISYIPKPDLILSWITIANSYSVDLAKKWSVPLISIFDNPLVEEYTFLKGFPPFFKSTVNKHEQRNLKQSQAIIVYSKAVQADIEKRHAIKNNFYFKAFTDFKRMHFIEKKGNSDVVNFVYVGSFFNWHKLEDLIESYKLVLNRYTHTNLYLVGEGPEFLRIKGQVKHDRIIFTGKLDGHELDMLMQNMHVGIISNALWFQAPVKLFQYSAAQLAVISRQTPTISELTNNNSAYTFFNNANELFEKMCYFLENPDQISIKGIEANKYVKDVFSEKKYAEFFKNIIFQSTSK